ncbi:hypothetical protein FLX56_06560 [Synechococcus moorigangaii CMS01]|nr:hypothetical protein [Synechococcus moorigangaii CMS01]
MLSGDILNNLTLPFVDGIAYRIDGRVNVGIDVGADGNAAGGVSARLTIEPGVTIFGQGGADYLVINRGSQIEANGTAASPITMTSDEDLIRRAANPQDFGGDNIGEWGGIVVLGRAPINRCRDAATPGTVDCENLVEGVSNPDALYGGNNPQDNSGIMRYVRVLFAGFEIAPGNELNGITLAGVGSGTTFEYIQVHNGSDDGIEWFGGTVNGRYLVVTGADDDSLDTDNGYNGFNQFVAVIQRENGGDNIVEASSSAPGVTPLSNATFANFTFVGNRTNAFRLNTGTVGRYVNGVVDYGQACMRWEGSAGNGTAGYQGVGVDPSFNSVLFDCEGGLTLAGSDAAAAAAAVAADPNNTQQESSLASRLFPGPVEQGVDAFDVTTLDSFFEDADYIGAFSATETETNNWAAGWTFGLFPEPDCPIGTTDTGAQRNGQNVCRLTGVVEDDIRLTRGNIYELEGDVRIGRDVGADGNAAGGVAASITIESGVTLYGRSGADYLLINRGSQIFANGTRQNPIIMTSENDITNTGNRETAIGEWGGLVILGRAPTNRCRDAAAPGTIDCENLIEGVTNPDGLYGGIEEDDSSGSLTFVQVKFAGFEIAPGNELNGITLGGVGRGTTFEYIQVHNGSDDGIEWFGGTVNGKYLVVTGADDDSFDTDNGWNGNVQFLLGIQRAGGGDNIVEASSSAPGVTPLSNATFSNFTFIGNRTNAFRLNTGTVGRYVNGVVSYGQACMRWESSAGNGVAGYQGVGTDPSFDSVLFDCAGGLTVAGSDDAAASAAVSGGSNNTTGTASTLTNTFVNGANENARQAFDVTTLDPYFDDVDYIGAVRDSSDRWWADWTCGLEAGSTC